MIRLLFGFVLLSISAAVQAAPLSVTLPSADSYCYWVQSNSGPMKTMPVTVSHKQTFQIAAPTAAGDHLFVLDAHTGEAADRVISLTPTGSPVPISLSIADFHPMSAPAAPAVVVPVHLPDPPPPSNGIDRLLTGLFSLLLAGGVGWLVLHLVRTRGEPLRQAARRLGVEVADPAAPTPEDAALSEPPTYASQRRVPEAVPDEAGLPPSLSGPRLGRGPELPLSDIPALLGLQGLAAGSTFSLTDGDVTVGRDGDNEIVLAENTVSRRHARLLRDSRGQFTLTDLGSANGVYINGTRVERAILSAGDEIKIGDNYFRFQAARET